MVVVCACLLASCRVRATVSVRVDADGSGVVVARLALDSSAVRSVTGLGDALEDSVRLDDLASAGWSIDPWVRDDDGGASLAMSKSFAGGDALESVLRELGGDAVGVEVELTRERGVLRSADRLALGIDATDLAVSVADDEALAESLRAAGLNIAATDAELTKQLARALRIEVIASVPGDEERLVLRAGEAIELEAESSSVSLGRLLGAAVAVAVVAAGVILLTVAARARSRPGP